MLAPLRNPANWDNVRKAVVLALILLAAASVLFGIIYLWGGEDHTPAPADVFRGTVLAVSQWLTRQENGWTQ